MRARIAAVLLAGLLPLASMANPRRADAQAPATPYDPDTAVPAAHAAPPIVPPDIALPQATPTSRSGVEIYRKFREGLADPECAPGASTRWRQHFAHVPRQIMSDSSDLLPMFGYVVDALHEAYLPTEFALIPFVESGYKPGARSPSGPLGLWQFIAITARNHKVPMRAGYDGRLSPIESTDAAVRYLKTLHGMFAGDWQLAVMAYNAGEYRVLGALKRSGQTAATADASKLAMPDITHAYVRKLHALSCLLEEMEDREDWLKTLDRQVPILVQVPVAAGSRNLDSHARNTGVDAALLKRLNPAFNSGFPGNPAELKVLSPATSATIAMAARPTPAAHPGTAAANAAEKRPRTDISDAMAMAPPEVATPEHVEPRTHVVARGESPWTIARRHGIRLDELLEHNQLAPDAVLQPGAVLRIDPPPPSP